MKRLARTHVIAAGVIACLAAPAVIAQSEKVSIRMSPRPDQSTRMTMTQEMVIDISVDNAAAVPGLTPMRMSMTSTMGLTQPRLMGHCQVEDGANVIRTNAREFADRRSSS